MTTQPSVTNWLSVFALGVIWGGTFMVVRFALDGYPPMTVACARTTLGAVALFTLLKVMRRSLPQFSPKMVAYLVCIGILNTALPFVLLSWGQQYVPSAFAGISMAALPLFVLPLAHLFSDEKMSSRNTLGVIFGFVGALVLIGPGVLRLGTGMEPLGQIACLAAAFAYAISNVLTRRCPPIDSVALAAMTLVVGAVFLIPLMLLIDGVPKVEDPRSTFAILFLGIFPTALAALLRVSIIRTAGSVFMTLVNYQVPLWSVLFGVWILNEVLPLNFFAALALILAGLLISQWTGLKRLFSR